MIKKILILKAENTHIQIIRFLFVGSFAFAVDFFILWFCTEMLDIYYLISATIAFIISVVVNYLFSAFWVFHKSKLEKRWHEFGVFIMLSTVGLLLNDLFLFIFTDLVHIYYLYSKILATAIVMFWNFFSRKKILFH